MNAACARGITRAVKRPLFRLYLAVSVDGFIGPPDGSVDWLATYPAEEFGFPAFLETIGTIVMGRTSYDQTLQLGPWPFAGKQTIVLTSRPLDGPPPGVERWNGDVGLLATKLRTSPKGDIWLYGGARSVRPFLDLNLVDRLELFVIPVLLGDGIPLFERSTKRVPLELETAEPRTKGVLELVYTRLHQD